MSRHRHGSIAALVIILIVVTVSVLLAVVGAVGYRYYSSQQRDNFKQVLELGADQFQTAVAPAAWSLDYPQISKLMESRLRDANVIGVVVELEERTLALARNANGQLQFSDRAFDTTGLIVNLRTIEHAGQALGFVRIFVSGQQLEAGLEQTRLYLGAFIVLVDLILSLALYLALNRLIVRPLGMVERYADEVARQGASPIPLENLSFLGELESLKRSIDSMVRELGTRNQELASSTERFERVIRHFPTPISLILPDGTITYLNECFVATFGYTREDIPNVDAWFERAYPDPAYRAEVIESWGREQQAALSHDNLIKALVYRVVCKNGARKSIEIGGIQTHELSIGILNDVTERVIAEQELARHREHLEELVASRTVELERTYRRLEETQFAMNHAGIAIQWIDMNSGRFIYVNSRACELYGYSRAELLNMQAYAVVADFAPARLQGLAAQLPENGRVSFVSEAETSNGCLPVETSLYLQVSANGGAGHYITFTTDISQRKAAEQALLDAKAAAEVAARTRSEFLANMSHEIRTPMNGIIGMSQLALQTNLDRKQRNYIEKVHLSAVSLLGILNDILDFSKVEAGRLDVEHVEFALDQILTNLCNVISLRAEEKGLELLFDIAPDIPESLAGDPMRLGQILINLAGNAIKFTERGSVVIACRKIEQDERTVMLEFSVRDTGIGMDQAQTEQLFTAFTQADSSISRRYGGTGLGLAICKRLVELMGGQIRVSSQPGLGSTFSFSIRLGRPGAVVRRRQMPDLLQGRQVLIVDDSPDACEILGGVISHFGFAVDTVLSASQALEKLASRHYDLMVCDWRMPGMDGLALIRKIEREQGVNQPSAIIMVSAYGVEELRQAAGDLHLAGILSKPASPSAIFDAIALAFGEGGEAPETLIPPVVAPDEYAGLRGKAVLLVEDNEINQELACDLLGSAGLRVTVANNGLEALACLEDGQFSCILMDVQMPVMDGLEAARRIRQDARFAQLPIIAMTAGALPEEKAETVRAGMDDHITKPIDFVQMLAIISRWVGHEHSTVLLPPWPGGNPVQSLPELDLAVGLRITNGKTALFQRLLKNYADESENTLNRLRAALASTDCHGELSRQAHRLKGSCSTLGLAHVGSVAEQIEVAARQAAPLIELARLFSVLEAAEARALGAITEYLRASRQ
jgi:PAS domain S-box-containing protein